MVNHPPTRNLPQPHFQPPGCDMEDSARRAVGRKGLLFALGVQVPRTRPLQPVPHARAPARTRPPLRSVAPRPQALALSCLSTAQGDADAPTGGVGCLPGDAACAAGIYVSFVMVGRVDTLRGDYVGR